MIESKNSGVALQRTKFHIHKSGLVKEIARRVGMRRGWRQHRNEESQLARWTRNVYQMLDGLDATRQWALLDHLEAVDVLGFDPTAQDRAA